MVTNFGFDEMKLVETMVCEQCGHEIALVYKKTDGTLKLKINAPGAPIKIINKELDLGSLICPKCGKEKPADLGLFKRF